MTYGLSAKHDAIQSGAIIHILLLISILSDKLDCVKDGPFGCLLLNTP